MINCNSNDVTEFLQKLPAQYIVSFKTNFKQFGITYSLHLIQILSIVSLYIKRNKVIKINPDYNIMHSFKVETKPNFSKLHSHVYRQQGFWQSMAEGSPEDRSLKLQARPKLWCQTPCHSFWAEAGTNCKTWTCWWSRGNEGSLGRENIWGFVGAGIGRA